MYPQMSRFKSNGNIFFLSSYIQRAPTDLPFELIFKIF